MKILVLLFASFFGFGLACQDATSIAKSVSAAEAVNTVYEEPVTTIALDTVEVVYEAPVTMAQLGE